MKSLAATIFISVIAAVLVSYLTVRVMGPHNAAPAATAAPASAEKKKETAYERVMRTGTIRCGYGISPPALVKDPVTGKLSGADHDIIEAIGQELGLKIEWTEEASWGTFIEGLRTGRYDAFCSQQWPDAGRTRLQTLTDPVIYSLVYAYVRADDHRLDNGPEAANDPAFKIPASDGDISMAMAKSGFPKAGVLTLPQGSTVSDMILSVQTRKADVVFLEPAMFQDFDRNNRGAMRKIDAEPSFVFASYYGFNSGETQLRDMFNVALRTLTDNGKLAQMAHSYAPDYIIAKKNY